MHIGIKMRMKVDLLSTAIQDRRERNLKSIEKKFSLESYYSKIFFKNKARVKTWDM